MVIQVLNSKLGIILSVSVVLLAVRMVADVTETRNVIPSLEFKTCMTTKSKVLTVLSRFEFENKNYVLNYCG